MSDNMETWSYESELRGKIQLESRLTEWGPKGGAEHTGTVRTPHGIAEVSASWWGNPGKGVPWRQGVVATVVLGGTVFWGRMERTESRALTARGIGIAVGRWVRSLADEETPAEGATDEQ